MQREFDPPNLLIHYNRYSNLSDVQKLEYLPTPPKLDTINSDPYWPIKKWPAKFVGAMKGLSFQAPDMAQDRFKEMLAQLRPDKDLERDLLNRFRHNLKNCTFPVYAIPAVANFVKQYLVRVGAPSTTLELGRSKHYVPLLFCLYSMASCHDRPGNKEEEFPFAMSVWGESLGAKPQTVRNLLHRVIDTSENGLGYFREVRHGTKGLYGNCSYYQLLDRLTVERHLTRLAPLHNRIYGNKDFESLLIDNVPEVRYQDRTSVRAGGIY